MVAGFSYPFVACNYLKYQVHATTVIWVLSPEEGASMFSTPHSKTLFTCFGLRGIPGSSVLNILHDLSSRSLLALFELKDKDSLDSQLLNLLR